MRKWILKPGAVASFAAAVALVYTAVYWKRIVHRPLRPPVTKNSLARAIGDSAAFYRFPSEVELGDPEDADDNGSKKKAIVQYSFDAQIQSDMENLFRNYSPDYGAFVMLNARTGRVLSMVSYSRDPKTGHGPAAGEVPHENLALRASFPSASVFKVVTAAAAIETQRYTPDTVITYNGRNHTLYRSQILRDRVNRWTRSITLKDAFANSINTVFGKIGAFTVGSEQMRNYADRFGFNHRIPADVVIQEGKAPIPEDSWQLAETSSGFTRDNRMSPLQGALIAAAIANDGVMMEPYLVDSVYTIEGGQIYAAEPTVATVAVDPHTASEIRDLMKQTVIKGTSRASFRGFFKRKPRDSESEDIEVGGKTGSLTGDEPPGKYDWFVGYGRLGDQRVAVAALTIHREYWRVKSSYVARKAIEDYFRNHRSPSVLVHRRGHDVAVVETPVKIR